MKLIIVLSVVAINYVEISRTPEGLSGHCEEQNIDNRFLDQQKLAGKYCRSDWPVDLGLLRRISMVGVRAVCPRASLERHRPSPSLCSNDVVLGPEGPSKRSWMFKTAKEISGGLFICKQLQLRAAWSFRMPCQCWETGEETVELRG